jgi:hypothetical protein
MRIRIEIETDNAAFEDNDNEACNIITCDIITKAAELLQDGLPTEPQTVKLRDSNGNVVGTLTVE